MSWFCGKCGHWNDASDLNCTKCGQKQILLDLPDCLKNLGGLVMIKIAQASDKMIQGNKLFKELKMGGLCHVITARWIKLRAMGLSVDQAAILLRQTIDSEAGMKELVMSQRMLSRVKMSMGVYKLMLSGQGSDELTKARVVSHNKYLFHKSRSDGQAGVEYSVPLKKRSIDDFIGEKKCLAEGIYSISVKKQGSTSGHIFIYEIGATTSPCYILDSNIGLLRIPDVAHFQILMLRLLTDYEAKYNCDDRHPLIVTVNKFKFVEKELKKDE